MQSDGTLAAKTAYKTGSSPTAVAIDPQGAFLYVTFTYQTGFSAATPGPGGVSIFPVNADNTLGTATTQNVGNNPVAVSVSFFNHFVYVVDQEPSPKATILGFSQSTSTGALTPVSGTTITTVAGKTVATGYPAGVTPSAIAEEPTARFVYVTDQTSNQMIGYTAAPSGALTPMVNGPFATGLFPINLTIDPTGKLIYVLNYNANTIQGYAIDLASRNRRSGSCHARSARLERDSAQGQPAWLSTRRWAQTFTPRTAWTTPSQARRLTPTQAVCRRCRILRSSDPGSRHA